VVIDCIKAGKEKVLLFLRKKKQKDFLIRAMGVGKSRLLGRKSFAPLAGRVALSFQESGCFLCCFL
jgi:hypothetical protein